MTQEQKDFLADDANAANIAKEGIRISIASAMDWGILPVSTHEGIFVCAN